VDTTKNTAQPAHPSTEEQSHRSSCFVCYGGKVYIGHVVLDPDTGDEAEVVESVPCRRANRSEGSAEVPAVRGPSGLRPL
jgi:hypothetical protein